MKNLNNFMIEEFKALISFRDTVIKRQEQRINFFLILIGAFLALLGSLSKSKINVFGLNQETILLIIFLMLSIIGLGLYQRIIENQISYTKYTRGINLIRKYFVKNNQETINKYITSPISDDEPSFLSQGMFREFYGHIGVIAVINSLMISASINGISYLINFQAINYCLLISICVSLFLLHFLYYHHSMVHEEMIYQYKKGSSKKSK